MQWLRARDFAADGHGFGRRIVRICIPIVTHVPFGVLSYACPRSALRVRGSIWRDGCGYFGILVGNMMLYDQPSHCMASGHAVPGRNSRFDTKTTIQLKVALGI